MTNITGAKARQSLALGYSLPIAGTTVAILFGLIVRDATGTDLKSWIWALIQVVIGTSLFLGAWHSNRANAFRGKSGKGLGAAVGARVMNFVLGIIWTVVTTFQAFGFGQASVEKLRDFTDTAMKINPLTLDIFVNDWLPAFALIVIAGVGTYLLMWARTVELKSAQAK